MAANNSNHDDLIFKMALLVGGYILLLKPILEKTGLKKDPEVEQKDAENKKLLNDKVEAEIKKQAPTKDPATWKLIADQIYADLRYSALDDNKADAGVQVTRVQNEADVYLLIKYFAKRREYLFGIPSGGLQNLQQFIIGNFSKKKIAAVNKNYASKGIKFRF